jgi:hypothetical protein
MDVQKIRITRGHGMNNQKSRAMSTLAFKNASDDFLKAIVIVPHGKLSFEKAIKPEAP